MVTYSKEGQRAVGPSAAAPRSRAPRPVPTMSGSDASAVKTMRPRRVRRSRVAGGVEPCRVADAEPVLEPGCGMALRRTTGIGRTEVSNPVDTIAALISHLLDESHPALGREGRMRSSVSNISSNLRTCKRRDAVFMAADSATHSNECLPPRHPAGYSFECSTTVDQTPPTSGRERPQRGAETLSTDIDGVRETGRGRRHRSLSEKQIAILEVIQRSIAGPAIRRACARSAMPSG